MTTTMSVEPCGLRHEQGGVVDVGDAQRLDAGRDSRAREAVVRDDEVGAWARRASGASRRAGGCGVVHGRP